MKRGLVMISTVLWKHLCFAYGGRCWRTLWHLNLGESRRLHLEAFDSFL